MKGFDPGILDADISKLFKVGSYFVLSFPNRDSVQIYMRVPSEEDINNARAYALRESYKVRKEIKDGTYEFFDLSILSDIEELSKEDIVDLILQSEVDRIISEARKNIEVPFPKEPDSDDGLEAWEKYQKEVDDWPSKFREALEKEVDRIIKREREALLKLPKERLALELKNSIINKYVQAVNINRFLDYLFYAIIFKTDDMKERVFESPEQVRNLPVLVRNQLKDFYEILTLDTGYLKK